jgi:hypothetical protein
VQLAQHELAHAVEVLQHVVVPYPQHREPSRAKDGVAGTIRRKAVVLSAVDFHDQFRGQADEVSDLRSEWALPAEAEAVELPRTKSPPQSVLDVGEVRTQPAREPGLLTCTHRAPPPLSFP